MFRTECVGMFIIYLHRTVILHTTKRSVILTTVTHSSKILAYYKNTLQDLT